MKVGNWRVFACLGPILSALPAGALGGELDALIGALREEEQELSNVTVTAHYAFEVWDVGAQEWKASGEADLTAWFVGIPGSKVRVDFHREVTRWQDGIAPFAETSYRVAYNGRATKRLLMCMGPAGRVSPVLLGELSAGRPSIVRDYADFASGWRFSTFGVFDQESLPLSNALANAARAGAAMTVHEQSVGGERTMTIELSTPSVKRVFVLQPDKGYSLLNAETTLQGGAVLERLTVAEVTSAGPGLYYPTKATREIFRPDGVPRERMVYEASVVSVNDPDWDDRVFDPEWPTGTTVQDQIAGTVYQVGMDEAQLEQVIAEQITWFAQRHGLAPRPGADDQRAPDPPGKDGQSRAPVDLLSGVCAFGIVLALGALGLAQRGRRGMVLLLPFSFFRRLGG